jgi:hypothetical protein
VKGRNGRVRRSEVRDQKSEGLRAREEGRWTRGETEEIGGRKSEVRRWEEGGGKRDEGRNERVQPPASPSCRAYAPEAGRESEFGDRLQPTNLAKLGSQDAGSPVRGKQ